MKFTDEEMDEAWERVQEMKRKKKGRVFGIDTETAALLVARLGRGKPANSEEDVQPTPTSNKKVKKRKQVRIEDYEVVQLDYREPPIDSSAKKNETDSSHRIVNIALPSEEEQLRRTPAVQAIVVKKTTNCREAFVPEEFKDEKIEAFFHALEKATIKSTREKILDRSKLPWVFASKRLACYVASRLFELRVTSPFARMEDVLGDAYGSLHSRLKKDEMPRGAGEVDDVLSKCKVQ